VTLALEALERRDLPSVSWPGLSQPVAADGTNHTLDQSQNLGTVAAGSPLGVVGTITNSPNGGGEVDFYQFTLGTDAQIQISTLDHQGGSSLASVLTLYQSDPTSPIGFSIVAQDDGATQGGDASLAQNLAAGTYFVAISGSGDRYFYPFLEGSGYPGSTGAYGLSIQAGPQGSQGGAGGPVAANPVADDTVATANNLGDITDGHLVQVAGILGGDPKDPSSSFNDSDVDLYHFRISTAGSYAFGAEVFAGRIGSTLDPALTLFQQTTSGLQFVASNGDTMNMTIGTDGNFPLFADAALTAALKAGDYYIAVSSGFDYVDPAGGLIAGVNVFDPLQTNSGQGGDSSGNYVLNLRVQRATLNPQVVSVSVAQGEVLDAPPTAITVQFNTAVNLQQLTLDAYTHTFTTSIPEVFITASDGTTYSPRLTGYDPTTNQATFSLLDALPNGSYLFHLSGPQGLTDLAGNPLAPNDLSGDYVVRFSVAGPPRGTPGNPTMWTTTEPNDDLQNPQIIGPLFPDEIAQGVTITRPSGLTPSASTDTTDYYTISLLQSQSYVFSLTPLSGLDPSVVPTVWANGQQLFTVPFGPGAVNVSLDPGTYVIGVDWSGSGAPDVSYQLQITMLGVPETAPSLTTGPAPLLSVRLVTDAPDTSSNSGSTPAPGPGTTVTLVGGALIPAVVSGDSSATQIFIALSDTPAAASGGTAVAGINRNAPTANQGTSVTQLSLLPGALVSINTLGLGGGDDVTGATAPGTGTSTWTPQLVARFLEALQVVDSLLPQISVAEAASGLTNMIDSFYIAWGQKASVEDDGSAAPAATGSTTALATGSSPRGAQAEPDTATTPVALPNTSDWVGDIPTRAVETTPQTAKQPAGWRFSPWTLALASVSACALLLGPLHVLRTRRLRRGGPPSSPAR
jgi:hypothetical protein